MRKTRMQTRRANYSETGDIVLLPDEQQQSAVSTPQDVMEMSATPKKEKRNNLLKKASESVVKEGRNELKASVDDAAMLQKQFKAEWEGAIANMWKTLQQPVWIPGRKGKPKKYTRGTLFMMDTIRFGATFAAIFGALFLSLNYQSFLTIVQASIDPLASASAGDVLQTELSASLQESAPTAITKGSNDRGSLLGMLPPVGPPDNRLIIPKLNLNVPIAIPDSAPLIQEDWKALETEIQNSLAEGVVHYPGTAKPGQAGNFFVTGHSSYYPWAPGEYKSVFARLGELQVGDEYWVYYGGDKHRYRIESKKEVSPNNVDVLDQPVDQRRSTLMTCTPVGTALRRLIVSAQELNNETGEPIAVGEHEKRQENQRLQMEQLPI